MRPCTILHTESSTGWGGQEIRILSESLGMMKRGHRVLLACQPDALIRKRASDQGIETEVLRIGGAFDIVGMRSLRDLIRSKNVDIVNTHSSKDSWCAGLAAKLSGNVRVIRTRHLSIPIKASFDSRLLYSTLPDLVVTTGEAVRKHVITRARVREDRVVSIPTGIDISQFDPSLVNASIVRNELNIPPDVPLVGTVGMLRSMKGHAHLLDAVPLILKSVPNAIFMLVGDVAFSSDIKERLSAQVKQLGIGDRVIMTGYRDDIPEIMAALDVFVLPSIRDEGVPQVISQAMAMKKPVVATDVGSVSEQVIPVETGFLVEKANPKQLAQGIINVVQNPSMAQEMGRNGRRLVERKFTLKAMLDATEALHHRLVSIGTQDAVTV